MIVSLVSVLVAAVASWIAGAAWYGVLGAPWMAALGWSDAERKERRAKMPLGPMATSFVAELVMAFMLAGLVAHFGETNLRNGLITASHCWLAFVVTTVTVNYAFQRRPVMLTVIDTGHWLLVMLVQGLVIGLMG